LVVYLIVGWRILLDNLNLVFNSWKWDEDSFQCLCHQDVRQSVLQYASNELMKCLILHDKVTEIAQ